VICIIGAKTFKAAAPDNDGTLTKDEYLALVEKLFNKVDVDHDGTLSVRELKSKSAHMLKRLRPFSRDTCLPHVGRHPGHGCSSRLEALADDDLSGQSGMGGASGAEWGCTR
jgi:EF hand